MKYLVLLIALGSYKFWGFRVDKSLDNGFYQLRDGVNHKLQDMPLLALMITLLAPIAMVGGILWIMQDWLFGLMGIVLQVLILFYAFGRGNLFEQTNAYLRDWRSGNLQSAYHTALVNFSIDSCDVESPDTLHYKVRSALFYQWFEQIFLIIFWYMVAGPLVALFIRLVCLYDIEREGVSEMADVSPDQSTMPLQLQHALEWLPARLMGITFAVAGNFTLCFDEWKRALFNWAMPTREVLHRSGMAALGVCDIGDEPAAAAQVPNDAQIESSADEIATIQDLIVRTLVVSVVVVACFMLF